VTKIVALVGILSLGMTTGFMLRMLLKEKAVRDDVRTDD